MNKKLLGIAAVALLGVSAAFAATTSTVYFTASGTLTKFVASQNAGYEDPDTGSGVDHSNDYKIGVSYVETSLTQNQNTNLTASKVYQGNAITTANTSACTVKYSTNGKIATGITEDVKWNNPSYIYHEILVSKLEFSKSGDYVILPVVIYNAEDFDMTTNENTAYNDDGDVPNYYYNLSFNNKVDGTAQTNFDVRLASSSEVALKGASYFTNVSTSQLPASFGSKSSNTLYLYIGLNSDITTTTEFSGYSILLPKFKQEIAV